MHAQKRLVNAIELVLEEEQSSEDLNPDTVEDYKKLNDRINIVISKIKGRKSKKTDKQQLGE